MIRVFQSNETNFEHCKNVLTDCLSAYLYENIDGRFYIELEYPANSKNADMLIQGGIIEVPSYDERSEQLFKIRKQSKSFNSSSKNIKIYAEAIARADADTNYIAGMRVQPGTTRRKALQLTLSNRVDQRRGYYVGNKDTSTRNNVNLGIDDETGNVINYVDMADKSLLKCLIEESTDKINSSIVKAYGGEIIWDNFTIDIVDARGKDQEFVIKSGKNLQELEAEVDDTDTENFATALIMKSSDGVFLPNKEIIYAGNANSFDRYFYKTVTCDDVSLDALISENSSSSDVERANNIVYQQLRERAQNLFKSGLNILSANYTIKYAELENTEEYKDKINIIKKARLGNNVQTLYSNYNISSKGRISAIKANLLKLSSDGKATIEEVEVGKRKDITDTINSTVSIANSAKQDATNIKKSMNDIKASIGILDGKIQLKISKDQLGSLIEEYPDKILFAINKNNKETSVTIDDKGLTVDDGKIAIRDNKKRTVFDVTDKGKCSAKRGFRIETDSGYYYTFDDDGLTFEVDDDRECNIRADQEKATLRFTATKSRFMGKISTSGDIYCGDDLTVYDTLYVYDGADKLTLKQYIKRIHREMMNDD